MIKYYLFFTIISSIVVFNIWFSILICSSYNNFLVLHILSIFILISSIIFNKFFFILQEFSICLSTLFLLANLELHNLQHFFDSIDFCVKSLIFSLIIIISSLYKLIFVSYSLIFLLYFLSNEILLHYFFLFWCLFNK